MTKARVVAVSARPLITVGLFVAVGTVLLAAALAVYRWQRNDVTHRASIGPSSVVLLGDSITELGDWNELLPDHETSNRGYSGYTTAELGPIAEEVAAARPRAIFLLVGTNDIRDGHPPSWTVAELDKTLDSFEELAPDTIVILQTILPRVDAVEEVAAANVALEQLAENRGLRFVDLYTEFDDGRGGLRDEETTDGLHLAEPGYRRWALLLDEILATGL